MGQAEAPRAMNPTKVFAVLAALVIAAAALVYLTRSDPPPTSNEPARADFTLTDTEAIARYEELHHLNIRAYEERDLSLVPLVYTFDSKVIETVRKDIRFLLRKDVLSKTKFEIVELDVLRNFSDRIVLREELNVYPRFVAETGRDLTKGKPEKQTVRITLHRQADAWLIFDQVITSVERL